MTVEEYTKALVELTCEFEQSQGTLINIVTIKQNEEEPFKLDIAITMYN